MHKRRKGTRPKEGRQTSQAEDSPRRAKGRKGKGEGKEARGKKGSTDESTPRAIARRDPEAYRSEAEAAFWSLSRKERDSVRALEKYESYEDWYGSTTNKLAKRERAKRQPVAPKDDKRLAKDIRATLAKHGIKKNNGYVALLKPTVIVADNPEQDKTVIADAGSVVQMEDQTVMYRDRISPITHRGDEVLVRYGKADKPRLGWITRAFVTSAEWKNVKKGPTFLVTTKDEASVGAWDLFRLRIGRARSKDASEWLVPWLVRNGAKYPTELRALVRQFGGKPIKNEGFDARCAKAFQLILKSEVDMATAKAAKKGKKSAKKAKRVAEEKETKAKSGKKSAKKSKPAEKDTGDRITSKHDSYIIKRLVKENPRRAGSAKAKIWDRLKKGMTVETFLTKGGTRGAVKRYIENGWIKLLRPKSESDSE